MPQARVQLAIEVETEGVEQLTTLRRQLEQLGQSGSAAVERLDASVVAVVERLEESRALVATSTREFLQSHRQLFASLEPVFQGFFNRLLTGSRNFRDTLKQLFSDLLRFFLRTIEQMVAGWLAGFRRMGAGSSLAALFGGGLGFGSGGGGLLGLVAPLLSSGFGFQLGPGGTPPTFPTAGGGGFSASGLNIFSQLGIPLRDLSLAGLTIPGGLLASGGLLGALAGVQTGSPTLGALGGTAAGFAFGGPIGALIGGIAGLLGGIFSRGKKKRAAGGVAEEMKKQFREIIERFRTFQVDFDSAIAAVNTVFEQALAAYNQIGKFGRRLIPKSEVIFKQTLEEINTLQKTREARAAIIGALPIPEFQLGGLVSDAVGRPDGRPYGRTFLSALQPIQSGQGKLLAFLHEGEAVLNARAVASLGRGAIEQMNRGPSFPGGGFIGSSVTGARVNQSTGKPINLTITINAAPGMDEEALANFTIRKLKRELQDRGLRLGQ